MELDDEDYELLGYAKPPPEIDELTARILWLRENYKRNPESARRIWRKYAKSEKGKVAVARRNKKHNESGYHAVYYAKNAERIKARVAAWHAKKRDDPEYKARRAAYDKARYERKKREGK